MKYEYQQDQARICILKAFPRILRVCWKLFLEIRRGEKDTRNNETPAQLLTP